MLRPDGSAGVRTTDDRGSPHRGLWEEDPTSRKFIINHGKILGLWLRQTCRGDMLDDSELMEA